jgi:hypothetical protein
MMKLSPSPAWNELQLHNPAEVRKFPLRHSCLDRLQAGRLLAAAADV